MGGYILGDVCSLVEAKILIHSFAIIILVIVISFELNQKFSISMFSLELTKREQTPRVYAYEALEKF